MREMMFSGLPSTRLMISAAHSARLFTLSDQMEAFSESQSCCSSSATRQLELNGAITYPPAPPTASGRLRCAAFSGSSGYTNSFLTSGSLACAPRPRGLPRERPVSLRFPGFLVSLPLLFLRPMYSPEQSSSWLSTTFFLFLRRFLGPAFPSFSSAARTGCCGRSASSGRSVCDFSSSSGGKLRDSGSQSSGSSCAFSSSSTGSGKQSSSLEGESLLGSWSRSCSSGSAGESSERNTPGSSICSSRPCLCSIPDIIFINYSPRGSSSHPPTLLILSH